jgi:hypothetical protein
LTYKANKFCVLVQFAQGTMGIANLFQAIRHILTPLVVTLVVYLRPSLLPRSDAIA